MILTHDLAELKFQAEIAAYYELRDARETLQKRWDGAFKRTDWAEYRAKVEAQQEVIAAEILRRAHN